MRIFTVIPHGKIRTYETSGVCVRKCGNNFIILSLLLLLLFLANGSCFNFIGIGMIRLVLTRKFPKNYYILPPDTYVCLSVNSKY